MASKDEAPTPDVDQDEEPKNTDSIETEEKTPQAGPDEVYCISCGLPVKKEADLCPECGVRQEEGRESQTENADQDISLSDRRQYDLEKIASKDVTTTMLWGFFLTPVAYLKVGKTGLALLNLFTLNYLLIGWLIVPFHAKKIIKDAREELRRAGVAGY